MTAKDDDRVIHQTHDCIARVRQRDAIADASAVQCLPIAQSPKNHTEGSPRHSTVHSDFL